MKAKYVNQTRFPFPAWLFTGIMVLFFELFLHFGTLDDFVPARLVAVVVFALGFGSVLGLILSFLPPKAQKWTCVAVTSVLAVLYIVQYFIHDAYQVFMTFSSILNGAEGVATNYLDVVVGLLTRNLWKILLVLLPIVLYAKFCFPRATRWPQSLALACVALSMYMMGCGLVFMGQVDASKFSVSTSFDNAVESFGLNMGLTLDLLQITGDEDPDFSQMYQPPLPEDPTQTAAPTEESATAGPEQTLPAETEATEAPTEPPKVPQPHVLNLDFAAMAEAETDSKVAAVHSYVASLTPAMENEFTGMFEGKNLIFITAEAFSSYVIDPERTPTLYRMANEGIKFTDYYQPVWGAGTTGGEYTNLLSLIPYGGSSSMKEAYEQDLFLTIGNQLQERGYVSGAFHNNDYTFYKRHQTHTHLGYDIFMGEGNGMEEGLSPGWPQSDEEMFRFIIPQYLDQEPFSLYFMTVSGHATYLFNSNTAAKRNREYVEDLDYSQPVKAYLACNMELEHSMTYLLEELEAKGIADDTVVVIATDHYPYGLAPSDTWGTNKDYLAELMGQRNSSCFVRDASTLIIWSGCLEDMDLVVDGPVMSLDILPTLSNLFGVEYDSRLMCGRDVFSEQAPLAFWIDYSWKTDKGTYNASSGKFTPAEGVEVSDEYIEYMHAYVRNKFTYSKAVQRNDYFNYLAAALEAQNPEPGTEPAA